MSTPITPRTGATKLTPVRARAPSESSPEPLPPTEEPPVRVVDVTPEVVVVEVVAPIAVVVVAPLVVVVAPEARVVVVAPKARVVVVAPKTAVVVVAPGVTVVVVAPDTRVVVVAPVATVVVTLGVEVVVVTGMVETVEAKLIVALAFANDRSLMSWTTATTHGVSPSHSTSPGTMSFGSTYTGNWMVPEPVALVTEFNKLKVSQSSRV
ncbi:MAG: hypothetical protein ACRDRT_07155 [Pseudonocardiaceae bacterium]